MYYYLPFQPADALLFLNGESFAPQYRHFSMPAWQDYSRWFVADGAYNQLIQLNVLEQMQNARCLRVFGDGDSILHKAIDFTLLLDQNQTDFAKILAIAQSEGLNGLDIVWASGGEMDHFLGNLSVAASFANMLSLRFFDKRQCYFYLTASQKTRVEVSGVNNRLVSLYPFPRARVTSYGLYYPLNEQDLVLSPLISTRNKAINNNIVIDFVGDLWVFIG